jgi:Peptidase family M28
MKDFVKRTAKTRYKIYAGILVTIALGLYAMTYMPGKSYSGAFPAPTQKQTQLSQDFKRQLEQFATVPRNNGYWPGLKQAETFIQSEIKQMGFENALVQEYGPNNNFKNFEVTINPLKEVTGTVVIGAHYDTAFEAPGADDNASSVVILLELAKRFKSFKSEHTRLKLVFFTNEEPPHFKTELMGSVRYAKMLYDNKEPVIGMYAFDALGYFKEEAGTQHYPFMFAPFYADKGNFVGFVGNLSSRSLIVDSLTAFRKDAKFPSEGVSAWEKIPGIDYSDHWSFNRHGWPALMVTDTAFNRNHSYHTKDDTIDTLDLVKMAQLTDELEKMFRTMYEK